LAGESRGGGSGGGGVEQDGGVVTVVVRGAKSSFPSPLMSPMLIDQGLAPVPKVTWVAKVGAVAPVGVVLSRMEAVSLFTFATAKSGLPSPLMSPMLTD
jgi:hypothetical protein